MVYDFLMETVAQNFSLDECPAELMADVQAAFLKEIEAGRDPETARQMSLRRVAHAGYYKVGAEWKLIGADIRGKVNVRKAEPQPNGKFMVPDVTVFYPNAVKGEADETQFTHEKIERAITNTNAATMAGGQKPGLSLEHPSPLAKMAGKPSLAFGNAINFRPSPLGEGWVDCDLVDVEPDVVDQWKDGRYTGLSAGFVSDANDINLRFGHVALLGTEAQALSHLPTTELFSATAASNQLWFSTESFSSPKGTTKMPISPKRKSAYAALKARFAALSNVFASAEAGEPDYAAKIKAEAAGFAADIKGFAADKEMEDDKECYSAFFASNPSNESVLPQPATGGGNGPLPTKLAIDGSFSAEQKAEFSTLKSQNADLFAALTKINSELDQAKFEKHVGTLIADGHNFSTESAMGLYANTKGDAKAVEVLKQTLALFPKVKSLAAAGGPTFSAGEDNPKSAPAPAGEPTTAEVQAALAKAGLNFSTAQITFAPKSAIVPN